MIRAAVLSASDRFHHEARHCAEEAGVRVELVLRSVSALGSGDGLDVLIAHRPDEDDLESIKEAVGSLPIVVASNAAMIHDSLRTQDGWAVVPEDDFPGLLAAARAAAFGLSVMPADAREAGRDIDLNLIPDGRRSIKSPNSTSSPSSDAANGVVNRHATITARELDVLRQVASGATNREIATALAISDNTVKYHLAGLYAKLNVSRRSEVIFEAIRRGILTI